MKFIKLVRSSKKDKKYDVFLEDDAGKQHTVSFGAAGYSDFTLSGDEIRKGLYLKRHQENEDWTRSGILTPGFWARWILWNRPTVSASLADVRQRFQL